MKNFTRTIPGKTIAFIGCVLSLCIFASCVLGVILFTAADFNVYTQSEREIYEETVNDRLRSRGYSFLLGADRAEAEGAATAIIDDSYFFEVLDEAGRSVYRSTDADEVSEWQYSYSFWVTEGRDGKIEAVYWHAGPDGAVSYTVDLSVKEGSTAANELALTAKLLRVAYSLRYAVYGIGALALLAAVLLFILLMCVSGRRPRTEEICPGPLHRVPFDLLLAGCGLLAIGIAYLCDAAGTTDILILALAAGVTLIGACVLLGLCMSAAARMKTHTLLKNTLVFLCLRLVWKLLRLFWTGLQKLHRCNLSILRSIPLIWKTALALFGIAFLELIVIVGTYQDPDVELLLFFLEKLILIPAVLYLAVCLRKLQKGGIALAGGDLSFVTDTKGMVWDLKRHGENLNSIADGMAVAVEERLKSERMKTELITNVSHDLKTPLTSMINYAALIGDEPCENEKITEYAEVLLRQSERLKRLIEDLVEASKASTGNLDVDLAPCDTAVFLTQAAGEYEEKLKQADLSLILKQPEKELRILADGRRMWRIFDNLMNNICKYAQTSTRVYLSLEQIGRDAVITFKNTSREPLDLSEEELMERFTRGDSSRNTEGNGLGLSIAKSMAELQKGTLRLSIDGDLFKAILTFPLL